MRILKLVVWLFIILLSNACSKEKSTQLQGYIEGEYTNLASSQSGSLKQIFVGRGDLVTAGQLLYILDNQPENDQLQQAQQQLAQASTTAQISKDNLKRLTALYRQHAVDQASYVQATLHYERDLKQIEQLKANINEVKWRLLQKKVYAPVTGSIFDTYYQVGEFVNAQQPVIAMLAQFKLS